MSLGGSKTPSAPKASKVGVPFRRVSSYPVNLGGFASANTYIDGSGNNRPLVTESSLSSDLQTANEAAQQGLGQNLQYIGQTPTQQYQELQGGNNPYYNLSREQNDRAFETSLSSLDRRFARNGLGNSTARGAITATVANDANLRDAALQTEALNYLNNRALTNAQTQQGVVDSLARIAYIPLAMSNQNMFDANRIDQASGMFNAQAENQMKQLQYQAQLQQAQQGSPWAQLAGQVVGTALGATMGPMGAQIGGQLGGAMAGRMFGGGSGGGASAQPVQLSNGQFAGQYGQVFGAPSQFTGKVVGY